MNLLAMDTSTETLSVAVSREDGRSFEINQHGELNHGEKLLPLVELVMNQAQMEFDHLDGIVCTVGPGSFTGIRIGISAANAIAMAKHIPVWGLSSLEAMAWNARFFDGVILATLDAQRDQFYRSFYTAKNGWRCLAQEGAVSKEALLAEILRYEWVMALGDFATLYDDPRKQDVLKKSGEVNLAFCKEAFLEIPGRERAKFLFGDEEGGRIRASALCQLVRRKSKVQAWPETYAAAVYHRQSQAEVQLAGHLSKEKPS